MIRRLQSALIALPIALFLIHRGGLWFLGLLSVVAVLCVDEFLGLTMSLSRRGRVFFASMGLAVLVSVTFFASNGMAVLLACTGVLLGSVLFFVFTEPAAKRAFERACFGTVAVLWVGGLLGATSCLRLLPQGREWVLWACVVSWGADTGAYFVGRSLGRRPLFPRVSPKKTWEGAVAGVLAGVLGAWALNALLGGPSVPTAQLMGVSAVASVFGQLGDLAESVVKRAVGAKDSGTIMPGHGGLLDRVDALLFAGPVLLAYGVWIEGL